LNAIQSKSILKILIEIQCDVFKKYIKSSRMESVFGIKVEFAEWFLYSALSLFNFSSDLSREGLNLSQNL